MNASSTSLSLHRVASTLPLLLLASLSLSPAWAGAFNSGITSPIIHQRSHHHNRRLTYVDGSLSSAFAMKPSPTNAASFGTLSRLLFLRGGDEDTVVSDETASLDATINMQRQYGTQEQDEEIDSGDVAVEMSESHVDAVEVESPGDESLAKKYQVNSIADNESVTKKSPILSVVGAPMSSLLKAAATFYTQQLTQRPIVTKSLTAGIIFGLSDWCAQLVEEREDTDEGKGPIVFSRILSAFLVGLLFFGPAANAWYSMIFKILPSTSLISTLQKAALGQIFFGPTFTCVFFAAGMIQSGTFSLGAWLKKIHQELPGVWASGLGYWPAVDFVSFYLVPVQWIPLFVNFMSFIWTIYLSLVANRSKTVEE